MQIIVLLPIEFKASPKPTVVVVLPSPAGVGLTAVTSISFPFLFDWMELISFSEIFALSWPIGIKSLLSIPIFFPISLICILPDYIRVIL